MEQREACQISNRIFIAFDLGLTFCFHVENSKLRRMKAGKAAGPDGIIVEMLTALEQLGIIGLTKLFNNILSEGRLPIMAVHSGGGKGAVASPP